MRSDRTVSSWFKLSPLVVRSDLGLFPALIASELIIEMPLIRRLMPVACLLNSSCRTNNFCKSLRHFSAEAHSPGVRYGYTGGRFLMSRVYSEDPPCFPSSSIRHAHHSSTSTAVPQIESVLDHIAFTSPQICARRSLASGTSGHHLQG